VTGRVLVVDDDQAQCDLLQASHQDPTRLIQVQAELQQLTPNQPTPP